MECPSPPSPVSVRGVTGYAIDEHLASDHCFMDLLCLSHPVSVRSVTGYVIDEHLASDHCFMDLLRLSHTLLPSHAFLDVFFLFGVFCFCT